MKIGIHKSKDSFSERWIEYCEDKKISYKIVDCYSNDIITQLADCDALMWHFNQGNPRDILFAKQLIFSVQSAGKRVFPDYYTSWHFDDKLGQKYLLESINAPLPETLVFYDKKSALKWASQAKFPKVFKLRGGGGSQNVRLVRNEKSAERMIRKAFGRGFPGYDAVGSLKERWRKYRLGKASLFNWFKGVVRLVYPPPYARVGGRERGYIYFQEYIPENTFDIRIVVIGDKAFAIKRMVRKDDFRASGSGMIEYEKENFPEETVSLAFKLAEQLKSQSAALDFVYYADKTYVIEVSFGFIKEVYDPCTGYWDSNLNWHEGRFNPYGWMVDNLIKSEAKVIMRSEQDKPYAVKPEV